MTDIMGLDLQADRSLAINILRTDYLFPVGRVVMPEELPTGHHTLRVAVR